MNLTASKALYVRVADSIRQSITEGVLAPGDRLPTEGELCTLYDASRITVRKALDLLVDDGTIERVSHRGCFVKGKPDGSLKRSVFSTFSLQGIVVSSQILKMELSRPEPRIAEHLGCTANDEVIYLERLRLADERPFAYQRLWLPATMFPDFNPWALRADSLRRIMSEDYGISLSHTDESLEALMPTAEVADLLRISTDTPLMFIRSYVYTTGGATAEYSETFFDTEQYAYTVQQDR